MTKLKEMLETTDLDQNELFKLLDEMVEIVGAEAVLNALAQALTTDELRDNLHYIARGFDW